MLIKLTLPQAEAACNAADLIADSLRADGRHREAALYQRASDAIATAVAKATGARLRDVSVTALACQKSVLTESSEGT